MRLPTVGRPEALGGLLLIAALLATRLRDGHLQAAVLSVLLGAMGAAHPAGAVLLSLGLAAYYATVLALRPALARLAAIGAGAVAVFLILMLLSPNGLADTLSGMLLHAEHQVGRSAEGIGQLIRYFFFWWDRFFFSALMLALVPFLLAEAARRRRVAAPGLLVPACVGLAGGIWLFGLRDPRTSYNLAMFFPVAALLTVWLLARYLDRRAFRAAAVLAAAALLCGAVSALSLVKTGVEAAAMLRAGRSYDEAKAALAAALPPQAFLYYDEQDEGLWVLVDGRDYPRLRQSGPGWPDGAIAPVRPAFLLSTGTPPFVPFANGVHAFSRPAVAFDWRAAERPSLFGVETTRFRTGYSFYLLREDGR
jgi:hypothetical protein